MRAVYRLQEPIIAIHPVSERGHTLRAVPRHMILEVVGDPQKSGLVDVLWDGQHIAVFIQDLKSRGELVEISETGQ